ncbi:unnamed protein product, partial [Medioppia subpectinata]
MSSTGKTDGNATQELHSEEIDPQLFAQIIGGKEIGHGRFGKVFSVNMDENGKTITYAIKIITKTVEKESDKDAKERKVIFEKEYRSLGFMRKLAHQHVVPIFKTWHTNDKNAVGIQMQFCACDLRELINTKNSMFGRPTNSHQKNDYPYSEPNDLEYYIGVRWLHEITLGLQYLHSESVSVIHRDVKPENIVMGTIVGNNGQQRWVLKLTDFGLAKLHHASQSNTRDVGTVHYMAPDISMT